MRALVAAALLVSGCSSEKAQPQVAPSPDPLLVTLRALRDKACACKDASCTDAVTAELRAFTTHPPPSDKQNDQALLKQLAEVGVELKQCLALAMTTPVVDAAPAAPVDAMTALREGQQYVDSFKPGRIVREIEISYVDQDGVLDREHGEIVVVFGRSPTVTDDPKRRTGAPVPPSKVIDECFRLLITAAGRRLEPYSCIDSTLSGVRCDVKTVWQRAVADGAPADALAVIKRRVTSRGGVWYFSITDAPRNVHISKQYPDDCPIAVEQ